MKIKLVLEARYIPLGSSVRKPNGEKYYTLKEDVTVHRQTGRTTIVSETGVLFLFSKDGITAIQDTTLLAVEVDITEAVDYVAAIRDNVLQAEAAQNGD